MKIKLIAVDLDGTLLTTQKQITPKTARTINKVRQRDSVHVVLCTARPPRSTMPFYRQLKLCDPMINYNGALVWDPESGKVMLHKPIPFNIARGIIKWARQRFSDIRVSAEIGDKWYTDFYDKNYQTETAKSCQPDVVGPFEEWLTQPVTKLLLLGANNWLTQVNQAIAEDLPNEVTTVQTEDFLLQIMHSSATKGEALKSVAAELGLQREEVMAIGDHTNDAEMIQWAGVGVAMGNAPHSILQVADHVADHNDREGVASAIRNIVMGRR